MDLISGKRTRLGLNKTEKEVDSLIKFRYKISVPFICIKKIYNKIIKLWAQNGY